MFNSGAFGSDILKLWAGGTLTGGSLSGQLPVDFSLGFSNSISGGAWSLLMALGSSGGLSDYGSAFFSGSFASSGGSLSGSGTINISGSVASGSPIFESVIFTLPAGFGTTFVSFPFDFGPSFDLVTTPEPATTGFIGSGLGLFGWLLRRRRKKA